MRLLQEILTAQKSGEPVALTTIVKARGSVPRHAGTKMLVYGNGRISGTIGGGEMESRVIQEAQAALQDGQPRIVPYSLVSPEQGDPGLCGGEVEVYVEPYLPPATLFVIGCGHVGRALAHLGHWLGYRVIVTDDREDLVTPELIPHADVYAPGQFAQALAANPITTNTFVAVVTRNVLVDRDVLPLLFDTPAAYIGVMGSRRRWAETQKLLIEDGVPAEKLARIHSPLGLELNAETPEEIAVSILAEITMLRRSGTGVPMHLGKKAEIK
ncbi:MAG: XdhC family protein [Anaerolineales bacterium]|nr:XdhC family protein [Anaerolineales bacterium]